MIVLLLIGIAIGVILILAAVLNWQSIYDNMEISLIAGIFGENAGRLTCLLAGVGVIGLCIAGFVAK